MCKLNHIQQRISFQLWPSNPHPQATPLRPSTPPQKQKQTFINKNVLISISFQDRGLFVCSNKFLFSKKSTNSPVTNDNTNIKSYYYVWQFWSTVWEKCLKHPSENPYQYESGYFYNCVCTTRNETFTVHSNPLRYDPCCIVCNLHRMCDVSTSLIQI